MRLDAEEEEGGDDDGKIFHSNFTQMTILLIFPREKKIVFVCKYFWEACIDLKVERKREQESEREWERERERERRQREREIDI